MNTEEEIQDIKRQLKSYRIALVASLISTLMVSLIFLWLVIGRKELHCENLYIEDGKGEVRAILGINENNDPHLSMVDSKGKQRLAVRTKNGNPSINLWHQDESPSVILGVVDKLSSEDAITMTSLMMLDKYEKPRIILSLEDGEPKVSINNRGGQVLWYAPR